MTRINYHTDILSALRAAENASAQMEESFVAVANDRTIVNIMRYARVINKKAHGEKVTQKAIRAAECAAIEDIRLFLATGNDALLLPEIHMLWQTVRHFAYENNC